MKKARALSTISTSIVLAFASGTALAGLPEGACFVLAAPAGGGSGVERMTLRIAPLTARDRANRAPYRYMNLTVVMAPRGQGLVDGVHGKPLTQSLVCSTQTMGCRASSRRARADLAMPEPGILILSTADLPVADYGESDLASNLAHPPGQPVRFRLTRARPAACETP